jgi:hypothetical protein
MTYEDYADLAAEMNILFRYIDDDLVEKIPQKIIEFFQDIASPTFRSKIDPRFPLEEQSLLPSTECMLTLLYRQYWATDEEREELDKLLIENEELREQEAQSSLNNIFDKIENSEDIFVEETPQNLPITVPERTFATRLKELLNYLTNFFKKIFDK